MPEKKKKVNYPIVFWDGVREAAQAIADKEHRGNLSTYINTLLQAHARKVSRK